MLARVAIQYARVVRVFVSVLPFFRISDNNRTSAGEGMIPKISLSIALVPNSSVSLSVL